MGVKYIRHIAIFILASILFIYLPTPVHAADFGSSGLGDIQYMWLHNNGNVRAIDNYGAVAEFNYINWKTISGNYSPSVLKVSSYDKYTNNIVLFSNTQAYLYNINSGIFTAVNAPFAAPWFGGTPRYSVLYNNNYYLHDTDSNHNLIINKYDSQGNLISSYNTGKSDTWGSEGWVFRSFNSNLGYYTASKWGAYQGNRIIVVNVNNNQIVADTGAVNLSHYAQYSSTNGVGSRGESTSISIFRQIGSGSGNQQTLRTISYNYPISGDTGAYSGAFGHDTGTVFTVRVNASILKSITYLNDIEVRSVDSAGVNETYTVSCKDNFGNIVFGGMGGRVFVRASSGVISTDTNFYSDYMMGNIVDKAEAARAAAVEARDNAVEAKNKTVEVYNIVSKMAPKINAIYTPNKATAVRAGNSASIVVESDDATHFQLSLNKSTWTSANTVGSAGSISIPQGLNRVYVRAYNSNIPADVRKYGTGSIVIFGL